MSWRPSRRDGGTAGYSLSRKLRKDGKTTDEFEVMLSSLPLEDVIALKLELASKSFGGKLYGLPIWASLLDIIRDAVLKYVWSASRTKIEAARFLGLNESRFRELVKKYGVKDFFSEKEA